MWEAAVMVSTAVMDQQAQGFNFIKVIDGVRKEAGSQP